MTIYESWFWDVFLSFEAVRTTTCGAAFPLDPEIELMA